MIGNRPALTILVPIALSLGVFVYGCGKKGDDKSDSASEEDTAKAVTAYGGIVNLVDFSSTLFVGSDASLRAAVAVAQGKMRQLQEEESTDYCKEFKTNFCDAKTSSRAGLLSTCDTECEDGSTPTTTCTLTENVATTCGNGENADSITVRSESTIAGTSTCSESDGDYSLSSAVEFEALLSSDSFEGTVSLKCTFTQVNLLPDNGITTQGFSNCEGFSCSIDGKGINCEQFQTAAKESECL